MKFSTVISAAAVAVAAAVSGCKYDKAGSGAAGDASSAAGARDIESVGSDVQTGSDIESEEGRLDSLFGRSANFEDIYTRCTDVSFSPVYFGFDSSVVPQGELGKIEAVADHLAERTDRVVVIEGNCDDRGSNEYNLVLGENRARIVRNYLVQNGISDDRIQTRSYGEERPVEQGTGEAVWAKNRRGEFVIFQK